MGKHDHVFNNLYVSMVKSGETGGSLDTTLIAPCRDDRARGATAREDQVGDDLPGGRRRAGRPDHVRDAAVRRSPVRGDLQPARRDAARCPPAACCGCPRPSRPTGTSSSAGRSPAGSSSAATRRRRRAARSWTALKLRAPVFGSLFHKTALSRFSSTLAMLMKVGRADPPGARDRERHREQQGHRESDHRGAAVGARR